MSKGFLLLLVISLGVSLYFNFRKPSNDGQSDNSNIRNKNDKSEAYQHEIDYLKKELDSINIEKDSTKKALIATQLEFDKYRKYIEGKTKTKHEKYTAINDLSGLGTYDFFAGVKTGDISERK